MNGVVVEPGSVDDVRTIQRRRTLDETAIALSLAAAERGTAWIARDGASVVGVLVARDSSDERYVGDWFVEPSFRGAGVGAALLDAAANGRGDFACSALVDATDAAALSLLIRRGIAPREPVLRIAGAIPKEEVLARMAAGDYRFNVEPIDVEVHAFALNELDRYARGTTRPQEHAELAKAATGNAFFLEGECVGYARAWPDGRIGALACASEAYLVQIFAYTLVTLRRQYGASWCATLVPGANRRLARAALRAGLRITGSLVFSRDIETARLSNYAGCHELLF